MPGIDLPITGAPDTTSGAPGQALEQFGQSLEGLGAALGKQYNAQQQALLDAETAQQVTAAQAYTYSAIDQFNQGLDTNIDYQNYGKAWDDQKQAINDRVSSILQLPQAQQKFDEWWVPKQNDQVNYVYGETRKKTVASAQATLNVAIDQYAQAGNEQAIYDATKQGVAQGVLDATQASAIAKAKIPEAHANKVYSYLDKNMSAKDAVGELSADGAADKYGLTPDQVSTLRTRFTEKYTGSALAVKAQQEQTWNQLLSDSTDPDPSKQPTVAAVTKAMQSLVGSPYFDQAKQLRDAIVADTDKRLAAIETKGETQTYSNMSMQMITWDGNGTPPWDEKTINDLVTTDDPYTKLTKEDGDKLLALLDKTQKEIQSGSHKGVNYDDPNKVADMMRIALDDKMDTTAKYDAIKPYFANGVSPQKYEQIRGIIDEFNKRTDWKTAMDPINAYYHAAIADPITAGLDPSDPGSKQSLSLEEGRVNQAMMDVFRQYPNDPGMWKQATDSVMDKNVLPKLIDQMKNQIKATFPAVGLFGWGKTPASVELEALRGLAPSEFAKYPGLVAQEGVQAAQIADDKKKVLSGAGVNVADQYRDTKGDWYFSDAPLPRDKDGNVDLMAAAKAGNLYQVEDQVVKGQITPVPVRKRPK